MTTKTITKASAAPKSAASAHDAIALLKADHEAVDHLFAEYTKTRSAANKKSLIAEICTALSVHAQIEEEIFYPAVKAALKDHVLVPEAIVEQASCKELIAQLEAADSIDEMVDAKVKVLSEFIKHHVKEEHTEMFRKAKASSLDMIELGARLAARKADLMTAKA